MLKRPSVTIGALIFFKGKILIVKSPKWAGRYIVPCGHVEFGEKLEDAVKREVLEETGLKIYDIKFLKIDEMIKSGEFHDADRHFVCINHICKTDDDHVVLNKEGDSFEWVYPKDALTHDLDSITRRSIEEYLKQ